MGFIGMMGLPRYLSSPELIPYLCGLRLRVLFNSATPNIPKEVAVGRLFTRVVCDPGHYYLRKRRVEREERKGKQKIRKQNRESNFILKCSKK